MTNTDDFLDEVILALQRVKNCNRIRDKLMALDMNGIFMEGNPYKLDKDLIIKHIHSEIKSILELIDS
jgi:hypothetical protein